MYKLTYVVILIVYIFIDGKTNEKSFWDDDSTQLESVKVCINKFLYTVNFSLFVCIIYLF